MVLWIKKRLILFFLFSWSWKGSCEKLKNCCLHHSLLRSSFGFYIISTHGKIWQRNEFFHSKIIEVIIFKSKNLSVLNHRNFSEHFDLELPSINNKTLWKRFCCVNLILLIGLTFSFFSLTPPFKFVYMWVCMCASNVTIFDIVGIKENWNF